ncbi:MAG: hypothetical protein GC192_01585 [Bacteroidetes bacterium]|nr:hypothetical protein [Bacteroidota bacterium]
MKKLLVFTLFSFFVSQSFCQLGLIAGYKTFNPEDWNVLANDFQSPSPYPIAGWQAGVDYWFRLKKRRIEFTPELSFSRFKKEFENGQLDHSIIGFHFNTDVYIFDLASDCNCPTFSKDGNFFSKGFFLELSPGVILARNHLQLRNDIKQTDEELTEDIFALGGSVGAGLDIGVSDLFTITPLVRLHYYPNLEWKNDLRESNLQSYLKQLFLGIRFRMHFKEFANARFH